REILHDLSEAEKVCVHDPSHQLVEIGRDTSDQLAFIPATIEIVRHVRPRYACPTCKEGGQDRTSAEAPGAEEHREPLASGPGGDLEVRRRAAALPPGEDLRAAGTGSLPGDAGFVD